MSKKIKLILLAVIVAVLAGTLYFLNADVKTNKNQVIYTVEESEVEKITFQRGSSRPLEIIKDEEVGLWKCEDVYIKDVFKEDMFNSLACIRAIGEIKDPGSLAQYGIEQRSVVVNLETKKGDIEIIIGNYHEIEKTYYVKLSTSDSVYLLEPENKLHFAFDYDPDLFIEAQKK